MRYLIVILLLVSTINAIELTGNVISDNEKMLSSRYMGFVKEINFSEGDIVKKGELIYSIDSSDLDNKKLQATLNLQRYQNEFNNIKRNLQRYKRLYEQDVVSLYELENIELGYKNLKTMIDISKSQLQEVENQYKYLRIIAPNDGVIVSKNIKVGEMALPGVPAIVLSDLSNLKILTEINEKNLKDIKKGQRVNIEIPSIDFKTVGKIDSIIKSSNPMSHTFKIKIEFDFHSINVYPGMYTKVFIENIK